VSSKQHIHTMIQYDKLKRIDVISWDTEPYGLDRLI